MSLINQSFFYFNLHSFFHINNMFKRLFGINQFEKTFEDAKIDKTHDAIEFKPLLFISQKYFKVKEQQKKQVNININISNNANNQISININNGTDKNKGKEHIQTQRKQIIKLILKRIKSSSEILRVKSLIVAHHVIRKSYNEQFMDILADNIDQYILPGLTGEQKQQKNLTSRTQNKSKSKSKVNTKIQNLKDQFIHRNIISFYCQYLKKLILNIETFKYAESILNGKKQNFEESFILLINKGFIILNLVNYIIQSQMTFNKMGRYYLTHHEVINLFIMYLEDLLVYNNYIKQIAKASIKHMKSIKEEDLKHHYIFITEAQKTSDRLYQFFYNRYYYAKVKKIIFMPTFLTIHQHQYKELVSHVKKFDKSLVTLVQNSKYQGRDRSQSLTTIQNSFNKTFSGANKTQIYHKEHSNILDYIVQFPEELAQKTSFSIIQNPKIEIIRVINKQHNNSGEKKHSNHFLEQKK